MKLLAVLGLGYGLLVAFMYAAQTSLIFPGTRLPSRPLSQPLTPTRLSIEPEAGVTLSGMLFSPSEPGLASAGEPGDHARDLLIGFGGNAQDAEVLGQNLAERFPDMHVAVFHYRGYGESSGSPSEQTLLADALIIFDQLVKDLDPSAVYALGISLGSGIAAHLSSERNLAGIILVTPYDSIESVAKQAYPWLPVGLLLKHRFDSTKAMTGQATPTAIIAASDDQVIRPERTEALRANIGNLVFDQTIEGASHGGIHELSLYWDALLTALGALKAEG